MSTLQKIDYTGNALTAWYEQNPALAARGIDESTWNALCSTIYPGAKPDSVVMAVDYCRARGLDVMLKPVHLVGMSVKNAQTNAYEWRDVPMPGVGLYRIQADRSGTYAGADEPEFGPEITRSSKSKGGAMVEVTFPAWCKYTVYKLIGDRLVAFVAKEYWLENYATDGKDSEAPNAMWKKRVYGQLAKCAEAQALRKAWPEIGQEPTAEEMEGKYYAAATVERELNPVTDKPKARTLKQTLTANQQTETDQPDAAAMPDFDDEPDDTGAPTVFELMLDDLSHCETGEDFKQWLTNAKKQFPDKSSAEYQTLAAKYNETVAARANK